MVKVSWGGLSEVGGNLEESLRKKIETLINEFGKILEENCTKNKINLHFSKSCRNRNSFLEFHHMNGDRSNNFPSNCEALCPNCHAEKTRKRKF